MDYLLTYNTLNNQPLRPLIYTLFYTVFGVYAGAMINTAKMHTHNCKVSITEKDQKCKTSLQYQSSSLYESILYDTKKPLI
jgi:hypothetical protein